VTHVTVASLFYGTVVDVDNLVQVTDDNLCDLMELLEVIHAFVIVGVARQSQRGKVADRNLIRGAVLDDLSVEVGAADSTEVLLVALAVAGVLVQHKGVARALLNLPMRSISALSQRSIAKILVLRRVANSGSSRKSLEETKDLFSSTY
jgi:hypothetical protein